jgi:hypothetical protein
LVFTNSLLEITSRPVPALAVLTITYKLEPLLRCTNRRFDSFIFGLALLYVQDLPVGLMDY